MAAFSHGVTGSIAALGVGNGRLYVAGRFTAVDTARRTNLAAFSVATGDLDARWAPTTDDGVEALAVTPKRVYLGGAFHRTDGNGDSPRLTAVDPADGSLDKGFRPGPPALVFAVAAGLDGTVYAGMGGQGGRAAAYSPAGKPRWIRVFDGDVVAVAPIGGVAYVGGHFDKACKTTKNGSQGACTDGSVNRVKLAAVDAAGQLLDWAPQANGIVGVRSLSSSEPLHQLTAGGEFTMVGGASQQRLAVFQ